VTDTSRDAAGAGFRRRDLELADLPGLATFAPEDWHIALDAVLMQHINRRYFRARVARDTDDRIAAVGQGIITGTAGWLGNIIVRPDARQRGLGTHITQDLIDVLGGHGCTTLLLIATALGEPVYRRLRFRRTSDYVFLRVPRLAPAAAAMVRRLQPPDIQRVLELDAWATAETRRGLLEPCLASGWGVDDGRGALDGFFLPAFGAGLVVASRPDAGLQLLAFKHAFFGGDAVVPAANDAALEFLRRHGARETLRVPRMALGNELDWRPECVFARASGYCG
jgi:ribosomal protein S18 acetylase RimI-like enzyme